MGLTKTSLLAEPTPGQAFRRDASSRTIQRGAFPQLSTGSLLQLLALSTFLLAMSAQAANWYVRPNGGTYGSENGTDWNNAFDGFSDISWSSVACGDTVWVAGGTYTQNLAPAKKCTSGARLAIRRARADATAATSAPGWSSTFASTVRQVRAGIVLGGDYDHITVSGRTTSSGGNHGWWIDFSSATAGNGIRLTGSPDNNVFEFMDIQGPGFVTYTGDGRGVHAVNDATGNTFSHMKIWNWESGMYHIGMDNTLIERVDMSGIGAVNAGTYHPNGIITWDSVNVTVRYSKFHSGANGYGIGEGIFFEQTGGCSNWKIYGNVFYKLDAGKVIQITSPVPGLKIFNNTFADTTWSPIDLRSDQGGACASGSETRNNLFYSSAASDACGSMSNNLTINSPNPFVESSANDYHIVGTTGQGYPRNAGANLSSYFAVDMDGVNFGTDGTWDIGAYEYRGTSQLAPPSNLRVSQ
jgi:hypothetical protein